MIADVSPTSNAAAAASLNRDNGYFAATDCLTCSTGGGAAAAVGGSTGVFVDFSQNPELPAPTAGFVGCGVVDDAAGCEAETGAGADACGVDAGEEDDGEA